MAKFWIVREIEGLEGSSKKYSTIALSYACLHSYSEDASKLTQEKIKEELVKARPDLSIQCAARRAGQIYRFAQEMKKGDFVLTPIRPTRKVLLGKVVGPYAFEPLYADGYISAHTRCVEWLKTTIRDRFSVSFKSTLGSNSSVFSASKHMDEFKKCFS